MQVLRYLQFFALNYDLVKLIKLNTTVKLARPLPTTGEYCMTQQCVPKAEAQAILSLVLAKD